MTFCRRIIVRDRVKESKSQFNRSPTKNFTEDFVFWMFSKVQENLSKATSVVSLNLESKNTFVKLFLFFFFLVESFLQRLWFFVSSRHLLWNRNSNSKGTSNGFILHKVLRAEMVSWGTEVVFELLIQRPHIQILTRYCLDYPKLVNRIWT